MMAQQFSGLGDRTLSTPSATSQQPFSAGLAGANVRHANSTGHLVRVLEFEQQEPESGEWSVTEKMGVRIMAIGKHP